MVEQTKIIIPSLTYQEWFINQKRLPDKNSIEYKEFYNFHKSLCQSGFNMGGTYINPFLYWHLNFWHTEVDIIDQYGRINQVYANPSLRDNEWLVTTEITRAEREKKGLVILGIRRFAKSVLAASYMSLGATFDENSQNVVSGLNAGDIKLITDKIDKGMNFIPEAWRWQRIEDNWKAQVTFGIKTKSNERIPFSSIIIRNLDDGNNEEAIAGTKPRKLIIDEIGKGSFLRGLQAAIPGFTTPFGWGCSPILTGTGGDMKKFFDAKNLMFDVEQYNFLSYVNEKDASRIHGLFISNKYRLEAKEPSTLDKYLKIENEELAKVPIQVSNEEKANKQLEEDLANKKKAGDRVAYLKEKMYYPKEVDDIFLNEDTNIFPIESCKLQQLNIKKFGITGSAVELFHDGEGIKHKFVDKLPIKEFPHKASDNKDAPIMVWEFPMHNAPWGLYTAGVDPYRQGKAAHSDSLGAVYIFKRIHSITGEKYQNCIVASYVARPEDKDKWHEQARMLIKYYNARTLCENDEISFIDYMKSKGDEHYLEPEPQWLKALITNSTVNRPYGIHRSAEKIRNYLHAGYKNYLEQILLTEKDSEGSVIREVRGVAQVNDLMLLEETIKFNEDINTDRIVAVELAIAMANYLDTLGTRPASNDNDPRFKARVATKTLGMLKSNSQKSPFLKQLKRKY